MGEIYNEAHDLLHALFSPFFKVPRKLKISTADLLVSQYRITPFIKKKRKAIRIPGSRDFEYAIHFLSLRNRLEPGLQEIFDLWNNAYQKKKESEPEERPRTRRRPRRRR